MFGNLVGTLTDNKHADLLNEEQGESTTIIKNKLVLQCFALFTRISVKKIICSSLPPNDVISEKLQNIKNYFR